MPDKQKIRRLNSTYLICASENNPVFQRIKWAEGGSLFSYFLSSGNFFSLIKRICSTGQGCCFGNIYKRRGSANFRIFTTE